MKELLRHELFITYFSPHSAHAIEFDGVVYPTLEHAYQASRYNELHIKSEIRHTRSPLLAWEISQKYKYLQKEEFKNPDHKISVMKYLMELKVAQHKDVRQALIDSGNKSIVKHIFTYPPGDGFWDDGIDGKGENHIGKIWEEIRNSLNK